jgi:hypothetical protein
VTTCQSDGGCGRKRRLSHCAALREAARKKGPGSWPGPSLASDWCVERPAPGARQRLPRRPLRPLRLQRPLRPRRPHHQPPRQQAPRCLCPRTHPQCQPWAPAGVDVATDPTAYMPTSTAAAKPPVTNLAADDIRFCMPSSPFTPRPAIFNKEDEYGVNAAVLYRTHRRSRIAPFRELRTLTFAMRNGANALRFAPYCAAGIKMVPPGGIEPPTSRSTI